MARQRIIADGFRPPLGVNKTLLKRVFAKWEVYAFVILCTLFSNCAYGSATPYILWLKSDLNYSTPTVNNLGTISSAAAVVFAILTSFYIDLRLKRYEPAIIAGIFMIFSNLVLAIWKVPTGLKFFSYIALGACQGAGATLITWMADAFPDDFEVRGIVFATMNVLGEITALIIPLIAWQVSKAPRFHGGFIWVCFLRICTPIH